ncbi:MAG: efflux RND transporter periplasmic adaptor subunit [Planctomycetota bacterium]
MTSEQTNGGLRGMLSASGVKLVGKFAAVFVLGLATHWLFSGSNAATTDAPAAGTAAHDHAGATKWTCSMHPQIIKDNPGNCPLCGMKLIPLKMGGAQLTGMRQLVVSPAAQALMNVQVTPVERRFVETEVRMVGKVEYDETRLKHITAWVPGRLDRLFVDYTGVQVNDGDHLVYIYSEQLYSAQQELIEAVRSAKERAGEPRSEFFATGGVDLLESAREKLRLLGLSPKQIATIEKQTKPEDHTLIHSTMTGIVIEKLKQQGDRVQTGERIYTIADLSQVWVKMDAYESDLQWLRYGQTVSFFTEAYPGKEFQGRIAFIDPVLNEKTRTVKVRVNVPNEAGQLKPEMFVRAVVKANIATGGRVIDANLSGKWVSPMHPEIIKDEPGDCDICGMPLVRAESLGYVAADGAGAAAPLVIPVTAALLTGTRAIVYVKLPDTKDPTFEGREIVLGPRAGDYYLVTHGLGEGEVVVTAGNFKIDSALQIQAKPSMMTPEGGGGGGHDHGAGSRVKGQESSDGHAGHELAVDLPISVRQKLQQIREAFKVIQTVSESDDRDAIHAAWRNFGQLVQSVEADSLTGHPKMVWKELSMLLVNDAVEGREAVSADASGQLLVGTTRTMTRLDQSLGLSHAGHLPKKYDVPEEFRKQLAAVWQAYQQIGESLAGDDAEKARAAAVTLRAATDAVDMKLLTEATAHNAWMRELTNLQKITDSLAADGDIKAQRGHFASLSGVTQVLAISFGFGDTTPVFQHHCQMAFGNKGAIWFQTDDKSRNPYFGATMLKCADCVEQIGSAASRSGSDGHAGHKD